MAKEKSLLTRDNAKAYVDFLKHSGMPYTLKISNYTTEIVSDLYNIQFLQSMRGKQCFAAYAKIKSDIKIFEPPKIIQDDIKYFEHDFKEAGNYGQVVNIDLKSAYATALFNAGYILPPTLAYLQKIPKLDRLASVGMLAGKKYIFEYDGEGAVKYSKKVSATENFFYYCAAEVQAIMQRLRTYAGTHYLFTWVDGIYLRPDDFKVSELCRVLKKHGYDYSIDILENFTVDMTDKKTVVTFTKDGKPKLFNIPTRSNQFAADLIYQLTNKNIHDENNFRVHPRNAHTQIT